MIGLVWNGLPDTLRMTGCVLPKGPSSQYGKQHRRDTCVKEMY